MVTCGLEIEWKYGTEKNGGEGEEEEGETFELYLRKNESSGSGLKPRSVQSFWGFKQILKLRTFDY